MMTTTLSTPFSLPTSIVRTDKDFSRFPAFAQQLRHPTNARVASYQQWNGSSLYESSQRLGMTNGLPFQWCIGRLEHYYWMRHGLNSSSAGNLICFRRLLRLRKIARLRDSGSFFLSSFFLLYLPLAPYSFTFLSSLLRTFAQGHLK